MDAEQLKRRTKEFALRCIRLADSLPNSPGGRTIANQMVRSGTSVGANYRAACRARSQAEFVSKMGVVEEEADETAFWMELVVESGMKPAKLVSPLWEEADELVRITVKSIQSARGGARGGGRTRNPKSAIRNP